METALLRHLWAAVQRLPVTDRTLWLETSFCAENLLHRESDASFSFLRGKPPPDLGLLSLWFTTESSNRMLLNRQGNDCFVSQFTHNALWWNTLACDCKIKYKLIFSPNVPNLAMHTSSKSTFIQWNILVFSFWNSYLCSNSAKFIPISLLQICLASLCCTDTYVAVGKQFTCWHSNMVCFFIQFPFCLFI